MPYITLISMAELKQHLNDPNWAVVDCRFSLQDTDRGWRDYLQAHITGAVYAHLDNDLAGPVVPGQTGQHPLPPINVFTHTLSHWGIEVGVQVVVYDDLGGAIAARLWWMLRWLGHEAVAVVDGGWPRWQQPCYPVRGGEEVRPVLTFNPNRRPHLLAEIEEVVTVASNPNGCLLDARSADRYRGENETIDPVAGHIPGAISAPYVDNVGDDGLFLTPVEPRSRYQTLLVNSSPDRTIVYCGSGVTAAHNLLAMVHAGLGDGRLYSGSWSEWITDSKRLVAAAWTISAGGRTGVNHLRHRRMAV